MYTEHFGLTQRPFGSNAIGARVFVGPQQATTISGLTKALGSGDAIVTISGRTGAGKTTIVNRAIESVASKRVVARVGRMHLGPDEVLELLLAEFGVTEQPIGTIQRYGAFKKLLNEWAESGTRVFILVEDAKHIGVDALLELEAMTAAESGDSPGANLLLMGSPELPEFLTSPRLDRLQQRTRRRIVLEPFGAAEIKGYLAHCFRVAGKEIDEVLRPGTAEMLYRLSAGIPRVVNNICETALIAAPDIKMDKLTPKFVETVALQVFGVEPQLPPIETPAAEQAATQATAPAAKTSVADAAEPPASEQPVEAVNEETPPSAEAGESDPAAAGLTDDTGTGKHGLVVESGFAPNVQHSSDAGYVAEAGDDDEDDIPEFIEDTQPSLKELPVVAAQPEAEPEAVAEPEPEPAPEMEAVVEPEPEPAPEVEAVAEPEPEPTPEVKAVSEPEPEPASEVEAVADDEAPDIEATQTQRALIVPPEEAVPAQDEAATQVGANADTGTAGEAFDPRNHVPEFEDIPTLSNSMRIDVPQVKAEAAAQAELSAQAEAVAEPESTPEPEPTTDPEPTPDPEPAPEPEPTPEPQLTTEPEAAPEPMPAPQPEPQPEVPTAAEPQPAPPEPEPEAQLLSSAPTPEPVAAAPAEPVIETAPPEAAPAQAEAATEELIPDAATLEAELAAAGLPDPDAPAHIEQQAPDVDESDMPALTLDKVLEDQRANAPDLKKWAEELSNAESLEDISDVMAETLFGNEEFERIAAEIIAGPPSANDSLEESPVKVEMPAEAAQPAPEPAPALPDPLPATALNGSTKPAPKDPEKSKLKVPELSLDDTFTDLDPQPVPEPPKVALPPVMEVTLGEEPDKKSGITPDSIEDQIETDITASRTSLDEQAIAKMRAAEKAEQAAESKKSGLFSGIFKRASKN